MKKRIALASYLALWAALAAGIGFAFVRAGYSAWLGVGSAFLLFFFLNGSLAYWVRVRRFRLEGKEHPHYLKYLFFPEGFPKFSAAAPRSAQIAVGIASALTGTFFTFCGVALAFAGEWSRISSPILMASICVILVGMGAIFLFAAWLLAFGTRSRTDVA